AALYLQQFQAWEKAKGQAAPANPSAPESPDNNQATVEPKATTLNTSEAGLKLDDTGTPQPPNSPAPPRDEAPPEERAADSPVPNPNNPPASLEFIDGEFDDDVLKNPDFAQDARACEDKYKSVTGTQLYQTCLDFFQVFSTLDTLVSQ